MKIPGDPNRSPNITGSRQCLESSKIRKIIGVEIFQDAILAIVKDKNLPVYTSKHLPREEVSFEPQNLPPKRPFTHLSRYYWKPRATM